jgi:hypothetical protein
MLAADAPALFRSRSLALDNNPRDWRGLFMASAFVVAARRPADSQSKP